MFRIVLLCVSVSALKLLKDPEFEVADALYDAECGDRYSFKCWRKGGHSLEKEEAAYVTALAWKNSAQPDATAGWADAGHKVTMTWNKKVDVVGTPTITGQQCDSDRTGNCATQSGLAMTTAETSGAKTMDFSKGSAISAGAIAYQKYYRVAAQSIVLTSDQSIKNAGKKKNANLAFTQQTTQVQATNIEIAAVLNAVAWEATTTPWLSSAPAPESGSNFVAKVTVTWDKSVTLAGAVKLSLTQNPSNTVVQDTAYACSAPETAGTTHLFTCATAASGVIGAADVFTVKAQSITITGGAPTNQLINSAVHNGVASTMAAGLVLVDVPLATAAACDGSC